MAVTIRIPTTLRILTSGEAEVSAKEGQLLRLLMRFVKITLIFKEDSLMKMESFSDLSICM